jgi:hypothetical protein
MQTAAETYGRAVDTIFVFDESKAKHDVNEVEESCAWWQAQSGDNRCPKDISELAWILE